MIDEDLKAEAACALVNAFWRDFSALVNAYLSAGQGLEDESLEERFGESTSVYGRDSKATTRGAKPSIVAIGPVRNLEFNSLVEALGWEDASLVYVNQRLAFSRNNCGEWEVEDV